MWVLRTRPTAGQLGFFRDPEGFAQLEHSILPELLRQGPRDAPFRVWVAGCATGEEVYSLAILLPELTAGEGRQFEIFATDVHHGSLEIAPRGVYAEAFTYAVDHPELTQDLKRVLATGERVERELRDAHNRAFFLRVLPYKAKGQVAGVVLTLIDVSGLLGLSDPREAAGKTGFELPGHATALAVHQQDEVVLRSGEAQHYELEKRFGDDGAVEWDLVTRLPLVNGAKHIVGIIGIFRSVTEQKRSEEEIRDAVRRRDEFLAMLSHELRNPLGAIVTASTLLESDAAARHADSKLLDVLMRQSQQMARLLDDLLEARREEGLAVVRVKDDGAGMPKEMLETAFELFVQSRRTLDRSQGGLGVGLTLVSGLITKLGGTVVARSGGEGKGSELEVRLPLVDPPHAVEHEPSAATSFPPGSRIVMVEDNADSREMLCALLTRVGFDCHSSDHGLAGLELIEKTSGSPASMGSSSRGACAATPQRRHLLDRADRLRPA